MQKLLLKYLINTEFWKLTLLNIWKLNLVKPVWNLKSSFSINILFRSRDLLSSSPANTFTAPSHNCYSHYRRDGNNVQEGFNSIQWDCHRSRNYSLSFHFVEYVVVCQTAFKIHSCQQRVFPFYTQNNSVDLGTFWNSSQNIVNCCILHSVSWTIWHSSSLESWANSILDQVKMLTLCLYYFQNYQANFLSSGVNKIVRILVTKLS